MLKYSGRFEIGICTQCCRLCFISAVKRPHFTCVLGLSLLLVVFEGFLQVFLMHNQEFWDTKTLFFAQIAG